MKGPRTVGQTIGWMLGAEEGLGGGERGAEGWEMMLMATLKENKWMKDTTWNQPNLPATPLLPPSATFHK